MSSLIPEQQDSAPRFVPDDESLLDGATALGATEASIEDDPTAVDLVVEAVQPDPVGRGYSFDFAAKTFFTGPGGKSPLGTLGLSTLMAWIEKCLLTERGAHPIHPEGYGMPPGASVYGLPVGRIPADLESRVTDALTFHPRISAVENFKADYDPNDNYLALSFDVRLDDDSLLAVDGLSLQGVI